MTHITSEKSASGSKVSRLPHAAGAESTPRASPTVRKGKPTVRVRDVSRSSVSSGGQAVDRTRRGACALSWRSTQQVHEGAPEVQHERGQPHQHEATCTRIQPLRTGGSSAIDAKAGGQAEAQGQDHREHEGAERPDAPRAPPRSRAGSRAQISSEIISAGSRPAGGRARSPRRITAPVWQTSPPGSAAARPTRAGRAARPASRSRPPRPGCRRSAPRRRAPRSRA